MATDGSRIYFNEMLPGPRNLVVQVSVRVGRPSPLGTSQQPGVLDLSREGTELLVAEVSRMKTSNRWIRASVALGAAGRGRIAAPRWDGPRQGCPVWRGRNKHHLRQRT